MNNLVTGAAGFIGFHLSKRLLDMGETVVGIDNINDYYDVKLKYTRLEILRKYNNFIFIKIDLSNKDKLFSVFNEYKFDFVFNLAAQAGVRYSLENPHVYAESNLIGYLNILEGCRLNKVKHLLYASSSSVYGLNRKLPFSTDDSVDHPVSFYAATKKSNELMAHTYSHLFKIPTTGLRFFTVYGPYGRPDMALFKFTKSIMNNEYIDVYNNGEMSRDFTYIDDIVEAILRLKEHPPVENVDWTVEDGSPSGSSAPFKIYNIGNGSPVKLMHYIEAIERKLNTVANKNFLPLQPGDVLDTFADTDDLYSLINFRPSTSIEDGVSNFIDWYKEYYNI